MGVTFSVREDQAGGWCVQLVGPMTAAQAIACARKLARDHHARTGSPASAEMVTPEGSILLGRYARPPAYPAEQAESADAAAA